MPASPISMGAANPGTTDVRKPAGLEALSSDDFFRLLVTELRQQDPLEPSKTSDMISNVSQIRSIEMSSTMNKTLESLARQQKSAGAADLIGKYVTVAASDAEGNPAPTAGIVTGVRFDASGQSLLELDTGQTVPLADVTSIRSADSRDAPLDDPALAGVAPSAAQAPGKSAAARPLSPLERLLPRWLRLDRLART